MTLVGTQLGGGAGGVALTSGGAVNLQAAKSSSKSTSVGAEVGSYASGAPDKKDKGNHVRVNSSSGSQGVAITGQGDLSINAAGKVNMEGTKADMGGKANINAVGGVSQQAVSKDSQSSKGLGGEKPKTPPKTDAKPDPKAKDTDIQADGGVQQKTGADAQAASMAALKAAADQLKQSQQEIGKLR